MEEREGFVENSKVAVKGIFNGVLGSFLYEIIIAQKMSFSQHQHVLLHQWFSSL